jgi:hypothetical protein
MTVSLTGHFRKNEVQRIAGCAYRRKFQGKLSWSRSKGSAKWLLNALFGESILACVFQSIQPPNPIQTPPATAIGQRRWSSVSGTWVPNDKIRILYSATFANDRQKLLVQAFLGIRASQFQHCWNPLSICSPQVTSGVAQRLSKRKKSMRRSYFGIHRNVTSCRIVIDNELHITGVHLG